MTIFWPVCTQISVIWIAQFKWWSRGVFHRRNSKITKRNRHMNALTSKLWFGRRSYATFYPLPPINHAFSNTNEMHLGIVRRTQKRLSHSSYPRSGMLNPELRKVFSLLCTLCNSNIAILNLLSCENSLWYVPLCIYTQTRIRRLINSKFSF